MSTVGSINKVKLNSLFKYFGPDSTVSEIADLMDLEDIGAVPILDDSYLLSGIVSERDIVRKLVKNGRDSDLVTAKVLLFKNKKKKVKIFNKKELKKSYLLELKNFIYKKDKSLANYNTALITQKFIQNIQNFK